MYQTSMRFANWALNYYYLGFTFHQQPRNNESSSFRCGHVTLLDFFEFQTARDIERERECLKKELSEKRERTL